MTDWLQEVSRRAGIDLWSDPIEARQVVTADGSILLVVGPLLVRTPETLDVDTRQAAYDALPRDADDDLYALADRIHDAISGSFRAAILAASPAPDPGAVE